MHKRSKFIFLRYSVNVFNASFVPFLFMYVRIHFVCMTTVRVHVFMYLAYFSSGPKVPQTSLASDLVLERKRFLFNKKKKIRINRAENSAAKTI